MISENMMHGKSNQWQQLTLCPLNIMIRACYVFKKW